MAAAKKNETIGRFTVTHDTCPDGYSWHVVSADGDVLDSYRSRAAAVAGAGRHESETIEEEREAAEEDARDAAEAAREDVRDAIRDLLDGCEDDAKLAAVLAMLGG